MRRTTKPESYLLAFVFLLGSKGALQAAESAAPPFTVPPGFVVERIAAPPVVEHPIMAGFDDRGRLFVGEAAGVNHRAEELLKNPPRSMRRLEDSQGTGQFDKFTVFADKMTFPMGALWHDGALYVCSPPSLWRLRDTNGDGVADERTELVTKFGFTGNAADIHGPFLSPDGRLYWSDGRHGHEIKRPNGTVMKGKAARIFRCKPDGSDVEVVCGGGMDDPVGMAFTEEGEPFAVVDILIGSPSRIDALIYCIEGGVYPYYEQVIKEFKRTGDLLPAVSHLGWVAPSGLMRYRGTALGKEFEGNLFSTQFNTHKVQRHILTRDGAGFKATNEDFLVSTHPDFHPTDVLEDADGSLIVVDTGGWFRVGCPTSQIAKPEVKGAIYRIKKKDAPKVDDPRGWKIVWDKLSLRELFNLLDEPRFVVRDRALEELVKRGDKELPFWIKLVNKGDSLRLKCTVTKTIARISENKKARRNALDALYSALTAEDFGISFIAVRSAGLRRDAEASLPLQLLLLKGEKIPLAIRREAATALGRIHKDERAGTDTSKDAVVRLVQALSAATDRFFEHALIYALIEIANREVTLNGLTNENARVRRGALIALDQMDNGNLTSDLVIPLLDTDYAPLQQSAWGIVTAHPDWAKDVIGFLRDWLARSELPATRQEMLRTALLAFCKDPAVQELAAQALATPKTPTATRLLLLEAMTQVPLEKLPSAWIVELGHALQHREENVLRQAVATIRARGVKEHDEALQQLAGDAARSADVRVAALTAAALRLSGMEAPLFDFLLNRLDANLPPLARLAAAECLGNAKLTDGQLERLLKPLASAGALEMSHLVATFEHSKNPDLGKKLLAVLDQSPGLTSLSADSVRKTLQGYPEQVRKAAEPLLKKLAVDTEKQLARLVELEPLLTGGDVKRGHLVFFGKKAACATCHFVKNEGGRIGPDLTKIGTIRTGRDLLEAVVFPSASIVRGYEPYVIGTRDGRLVTGIIVRETAEALFLATADRAEIRVPRSAIDSLDRAKVSIMPQGLDAQLSKQELSDLIAFLQSLR